MSTERRKAAVEPELKRKASDESMAKELRVSQIRPERSKVSRSSTDEICCRNGFADRLPERAYPGTAASGIGTTRSELQSQTATSVLFFQRHRLATSETPMESGFRVDSRS